MQSVRGILVDQQLAAADEFVGRAHGLFEWRRLVDAEVEILFGHFHEGNQRIRERGVGSSTISSGVPISKPVAARVPATCSVTGTKSLARV